MQAGYGVWYGGATPETLRHTSRHMNGRASVEGWGLQGVLHALLHQGAARLMVVQSVFSQLLRSGHRACVGVDGARLQGRWDIEICGSRSCGCVDKQVNRCRYGGCPCTLMPGAMNTG